MLSTKFTEHLALLGCVLFLGCVAIALDPSTYPDDVISLRLHHFLFAEETRTQIFSTSYNGFSTGNIDASSMLVMFSLHSSAFCFIPWYHEFSKDGMLVDEDRVLTVKVENRCPFSIKMTLVVDAPDFALKQQADPTFSIIPHDNRPWKWVLKALNPCSPCDITINVLAENMNPLSPQSGAGRPEALFTFTPEPSISFGLSVSGTFSIYTLLLKLLNSLSVVFGSMLTIPWWYEQWQRHKDRKKDGHSPQNISRSRKNVRRSKKCRKSK